eukprot:jgi/Bigna1/80972/fgenesh1_pg.76_\
MGKSGKKKRKASTTNNVATASVEDAQTDVMRAMQNLFELQKKTSSSEGHWKKARNEQHVMLNASNSRASRRTSSSSSVSDSVSTVSTSTVFPVLHAVPPPVALDDDNASCSSANSSSTSSSVGALSTEERRCAAERLMDAMTKGTLGTMIPALVRRLSGRISRSSLCRWSRKLKRVDTDEDFCLNEVLPSSGRPHALHPNRVCKILDQVELAHKNDLTMRLSEVESLLKSEQARQSNFRSRVLGKENVKRDSLTAKTKKHVLEAITSIENSTKRGQESTRARCMAGGGIRNFLSFASLTVCTALDTDACIKTGKTRHVLPRECVGNAGWTCEKFNEDHAKVSKSADPHVSKKGAKDSRGSPREGSGKRPDQSIEHTAPLTASGPSGPVVFWKSFGKPTSPLFVEMPELGTKDTSGPGHLWMTGKETSRDEVHKKLMEEVIIPFNNKCCAVAGEDDLPFFEVQNAGMGRANKHLALHNHVMGKSPASASADHQPADVGQVHSTAHHQCKQKTDDKNDSEEHVASTKRKRVSDRVKRALGGNQDVPAAFKASLPGFLGRMSEVPVKDETSKRCKGFIRLPHWRTKATKLIPHFAMSMNSEGCMTESEFNAEHVPVDVLHNPDKKVVHERKESSNRSVTSTHDGWRQWRTHLDGKKEQEKNKKEKEDAKKAADEQSVEIRTSQRKHHRSCRRMSVIDQDCVSCHTCKMPKHAFAEPPEDATNPNDHGWNSQLSCDACTKWWCPDCCSEDALKSHSQDEHPCNWWCMLHNCAPLRANCMHCSHAWQFLAHVQWLVWCMCGCEQSMHAFWAHVVCMGTCVPCACTCRDFKSLCAHPWLHNPKGSVSLHLHAPPLSIMKHSGIRS